MSPTPIATTPTVKVGGKTYGVRFSQGAFYLLSTWGLDISRPVDLHNHMIATGRAKEYAAKLAAASIGNFDANNVWHSAAIPPLEMMDQLHDDEWNALDLAVWTEYKKKVGLVERTDPKATETPTTDSSTKTDGQSSGPSEPARVPPGSELAA